MSKPAPTIRQVAEACGVSPMTVSYVLNKPARVGAGTRERVLQAMRDMNYRPGARGQGRHSRHTDTLGVLSGLPNDPAIEYSYLRLILGGVFSAANSRQQNVTIFSAHLWGADVHRSVRVFCDGRCDGLIVVAPGPDSEVVLALKNRGIPFVIVGDTSHVDCTALDVENAEGARKATSYLLGLGHRRIALIKGFAGHPSIELRQTGYEQAYRDHGLPLDTTLVIQGGPGQNSHRERALVLLKRPARDRPTAILCGNDEVAIEAMHAARQLGLDVPGDVSVIGFDDGPLASQTAPPLTTVRQPFQRIGERAVEIVLAWVGNPSLPPRQELLPTELVIRQSTAPPPG